MSQTAIKPEYQFIEDHWSFIERLLLVLKKEEFTLSDVGFFYRESMLHGYKHGKNSPFGPRQEGR